jgi:D-alanine-D-alanine ligase
MKIALAFSIRERRAELTFDDRDDHDEEFDSPETIAALADVLRDLGHDVELIGEGEPMLRRLLEGPRPDLVMNLAEGRIHTRSREASVPAVLEMLDIPYTGSDPLTLAATLDKDVAKRLVTQAGVATPRWVLFDGDLQAVREQATQLTFPVFIKPAWEGSSKGIVNASMIHEMTSLLETLPRFHDAYRQPILIEEFIEGDELTVGMLGNPPEVLGIMRVLPRVPQKEPFVYSLEVKRNWQNRVRYECPAQLAPSDTAKVKAAALSCWHALGCRDVARFDFRLRSGVPYFLEVNPLPGLSPTSGDLVILAGLVGIDYPELIERIVSAAIERNHLHARASSLQHSVAAGERS